MVEPVSLALIVSALIIVIGFLGNFLFEKKGVPDMLFLIFLGIAVGPVLHIFEPNIVSGLAPYISALALIFILFDGGMRMGIRQALSHSPRAVLLAVTGFILSMLVVALFTIFVMGVPLFYGLLFGSIYGGSSSIVVVSLTAKIKISEKGATTLILESAITDILCIVVSLALIGVILTGHTDYAYIGLGIAGRFIIGVVVGIFSGIAWLIFLKRVADLPFCYMLTLAIALFAYAISEVLGGSGALSSLLFGLILGNETQILNFLHLGTASKTSVDEGLKRFESEIAFFIRTFFFVFLGIIATISNVTFVFLGVMLSLLLLAVRIGAVQLSTFGSELRKERSIMSVVLTRGLAAAVLATLPAQYGLLYSDLFINFAVVIIVSTAIIATVGVIGISRKQERAPKKTPVSHDQVAGIG
ncbi:MAG: cation:proton antiporter [Candidatus Bathyarchaeota archaeon]|nr:cation:proton antiporter [Candidatus Bathyarchaeota archaeon]